MDGVLRADLQGVVALLNFMEPMAEKPFARRWSRWQSLWPEKRSRRRQAPDRATSAQSL